MNSMTLFQNETGEGPAKSLLAAGIDHALGEGIRSSYAIVGIKASRFRIKYKGAEILAQKLNTDTGQMEPVSSIEVVIVKANPFLNKQYYAGKYVDGSTAAPDCYSLDGKVPSPSIPKPVFSNCTMCPKNQYASLVSETGVKQKACRDTKKLAIVPLWDLRNETYGGPMLFRVPPSGLKDLSQLADAMKARGYPYNSVAVRIGFDVDASHPKPTFKAIRPLSEAEAEVILELFHGDGVAAVLSDNDAVVDAHVGPVESSTLEQEPIVPVGTQAAKTVAPAVAVEVPVEPPAKFVAPPVAAMPPGVQATVVQAFNPKAAPVMPAVAAAFAPPPNPVGRPKKVKEVAATDPSWASTAAPVLVEPTPEPQGSTLTDDIDSIIKGLSAFTSSSK